jgi:Zn-dependent protease with chaperone function
VEEAKVRKRQDVDLLAWRLRVAAVAAVCEQTPPEVAGRWNTRYNRHRDELGIARRDRALREGSEHARRAVVAHELGHRASPYRKEDRVRAQWARPAVRTAAGVVSLVIVGLTVFAATVATLTAILLEVASVSVGLAVIGSVLMHPLIGELHAAEFAADDYAADHTGTAATVESLTQLRYRFEWVTALVPFFNTHPPTTVRIQRQHSRAAASSPPG